MSAAADTAEAAGTPAAPSPYILSPFADTMLLGGASLVFFGLLAAFHSGQRTPLVWQTAAALVWVVNWPHFAATSLRLYGAPARIMKYPVTALGVPAVLFFAVAAGLSEPDAVGTPLVKLFMLWSPYHFAGQAYGLTMLYARRSGIRAGLWESRVLYAFTFGTALAMTARSEVGTSRPTFFGVTYPMLGIPRVVGELLLIATGLAALAGLVVLWRWHRRRPGGLPLVVPIPAVSLFVWFAPGIYLASFYEFVPFFHSLQYLVVAWALDLEESRRLAGGRGGRAFAVARSARWFAGACVGGVGLFWLFPRVVGGVSGAELMLANGVVHAAVQIHHFLVDGVIWRLRDPSVASPLEVRLADILAEPEAAAA